jgi:PAS domain S-box-containing protein
MEKEAEIYKTLIQSLPDIVYKIDTDGYFTFINDAICKLGYTPEELIGEHFTKILHPEDADSVQREIVLLKLRGAVTGDKTVPQLFDERRTGERITRNLRVRLLPKVHYNKENYPAGEVIAIGLHDTIGGIQKKFFGTVGIIRDISEIQRIERTLLLTEQYYRLLINNSLNIFTLLSSDGTILYISDSMRQILGYEPIDLIGENVFHFTHQEDNETMENLLRGVNDKPDTTHLIEHRFRQGDGSWSILESHAKKIFDSHNQVVTTVLYSHDITGRKQADRALHESEIKYRLIADNMLDLVAMSDAEGRFSFVSPSYKTVLGYSPDELLGQPIHILVHPDDLSDILTLIDERRCSLKPATAVYRMRHKEGHYLWFETYGHVIDNNEGENIGAVFNTRDVTDRIQAEEISRESVDKYRTIIENMEEGYYEVDLTGNFTFVNNALCRISGATYDELIGMNYKNYMDEATAKRVYRLFNDIYRTGQALKYDEWEVTIVDGSKRIHSGSVTLIHNSVGQPTGFRGVVRDITDRKHAEEQIKASLREKEILLKEIHHRVKNNFQIIISLLNIQGSTIQDKELLNVFMNSQNRIRAMSLIHEKLYQSEDLARIDFAEYINIIARELYGVYKCVPNRVVLTIEAENVHLSIDQAIPCGLIINELLSNTFKYAFPSEWEGQGKVKIAFIRHNDTVELSIGDNGIGMRGDIDLRNTKSLGLRLVTLLVEQQLKGSIKVKHQKGTQFTITFTTKQDLKINLSTSPLSQ